MPHHSWPKGREEVEIHFEIVQDVPFQNGPLLYREKGGKMMENPPFLAIGLLIYRCRQCLAI
jgi:hypothetical protein